MSKVRINIERNRKCLGSLQLLDGELLLLHQEISEAANGIYIDNFDDQVGISRDRASQILSALTSTLDQTSLDSDGIPHGYFELQFCAPEGRAIRNCMELVLADLGPEEFSIRTGFSFDEGRALFDKMNDALFDALHIQQGTAAHSSRI